MTISLPRPYQYVRLGTVSSTLDEAENLLLAGVIEHGAVITAYEQTQGRGRHARPWVSKPGNLYASLIVQPEKRVSVWPQISFVMALALAEAVAAALPHKDVTLKWPNDVLVDGKKISGLLIERKVDQQERDVLVVGFGVNCLSCPEGVAYPTTCLADEGANDASCDALLTPIIVAFDRYYQLWLEKGFTPIRDAWLARARGVGSSLTIKQPQGYPGGDLTAIFSDIDPHDGALIVKTGDGALVRINAGDIYFTPSH